MFVELPTRPNENSGPITLAVKDDGHKAYEFFYRSKYSADVAKRKLQVKKGAFTWLPFPSKWEPRNVLKARANGRYEQLMPFSSIESVELLTHPRGIAHIVDVRVVPDNGKLDGYEATNVRKLTHPLRVNDVIRIRGKLVAAENADDIATINLLYGLYGLNEWNSFGMREMMGICNKWGDWGEFLEKTEIQK